MIPQTLLRRLSERRLSPRHDGIELAGVTLTALEISLDSEVGEFYLKYDPSLLCSDTSNEQLLDVVAPTIEGVAPTLVDVWETPVGRATQFVREVWEVPNNLICLTTTEGEGAYLYDAISGGVYDFDLEQQIDLVSGQLSPRWPSFFEFLEWYLS